jgi:hypothetical protein
MMGREMPMQSVSSPLSSKVEAIQGGNQRFEFTYKLVISDSKSSAQTVRVFDRIPIPDQTLQTSMTLGDPSIPQSDDAIYRRILTSLGSLRFDMNVPAKSFGGDAVEILYSYTAEFDRNRRLTVQAPNWEEDAMLDIQMPGIMGGGMGCGC